MSIRNSLVDSVKGLVDFRLLSVCTSIPAVVEEVNYSKGTVKAQPLINTKHADGTHSTPPVLAWIPLMVNSGNGARITFPVKKGDTVLVLFSQRETGTFMQSSGKATVDSNSRVPVGMYPILAIPCLYTNKSASPIDPSNVIIENSSSKVTISPSGEVTIDAPSAVTVNTGNATVNATSSATITSPTTTINGNLTVTGNTTLTGPATMVGGIGGGGGTTTFNGSISVTGAIDADGTVTAAGFVTA